MDKLYGRDIHANPLYHYSCQFKGGDMGLGDVYQRALINKYQLPDGWVANWPPRFVRELGEVGIVTPGGFNRDAMLSDKGINASPDPNPEISDGSWNFQSDESINVAVGVDASMPGFEFIGNAKAGLKINFGRSEGAVVGIGGTRHDRLRNIDALKPRLLAAAESGKIEVGKAVVVEVLSAVTGLVVTSEGNNAEFDATTNADFGAAGSPSVATFGVNLSVKSGSHAAAQEPYPHGFSVAFRVLKLGRRGWWWWRHIVVFGISPGRIGDGEELLTEADYFALLPGAQFDRPLRLEG